MVQEAAEFTGGRYTVKHVQPYAGYAIRNQAPSSGRLARFARGESAVLFFQLRAVLRRAADFLTGVVLRPDGQPAAGVEVALADAQHPRRSTSCSGLCSNGMSFAKTGPDGRFSFAKPGGSYRLAAMSDDGFAGVRAG